MLDHQSFQGGAGLKRAATHDRFPPGGGPSPSQTPLAHPNPLLHPLRPPPASLTFVPFCYSRRVRPEIKIDALFCRPTLDFILSAIIRRPLAAVFARRHGIGTPHCWWVVPRTPRRPGRNNRPNPPGSSDEKESFGSPRSSNRSEQPERWWAMARREALLRLHKSLTSRRDELRSRLGMELKDLGKSQPRRRRRRGVRGRLRRGHQPLGRTRSPRTAAGRAGHGEDQDRHLRCLRGLLGQDPGRTAQRLAVQHPVREVPAGDGNQLRPAAAAGSAATGTRSSITTPASRPGRNCPTWRWTCRAKPRLFVDFPQKSPERSFNKAVSGFVHLPASAGRSQSGRRPRGTDRTRRPRTFSAF